MFHDDSMKSFFRRLTFTPDGSFLLAPGTHTHTHENNYSVHSSGDLKQEEIVSCAAVISYDVEVIGDILFSPFPFSMSLPLSLSPFLSLCPSSAFSLYV